MPQATGVVVVVVVTQRMNERLECQTGDVPSIRQLEFGHSVLRERPVPGHNQLLGEDSAHVGRQPRSGRQSHFLLPARLHH